MTDVPDGTAQEVLDWVGGDPSRADAALHAEYARPSPRTTLIAKLEPILKQEAPPMTDETETTEEEVEEAPAPVPPSGDELSINLLDQGTYIGPANLANADVSKPDDSYDLQAAEARADDDTDELVVDAEPVEFFQVAANGGVVVVNFDGSAVLLDKDQVAALSKDLRSAMAGVTY